MKETYFLDTVSLIKKSKVHLVVAPAAPIFPE